MAGQGTSLTCSSGLMTMPIRKLRVRASHLCHSNVLEPFLWPRNRHSKGLIHTTPHKSCPPVLDAVTVLSNSGTLLSNILSNLNRGSPRYRISASSRIVRLGYPSALVLSIFLIVFCVPWQHSKMHPFGFVVQVRNTTVLMIATPPHR